jgi:hypothetical protein
MQKRVHGWVGRKDRHPVEIDAVVHRLDGTRAPVKLSDFSDEGCRIESGASFHIGERLQIAIPRMGQIRAQVRWIGAGTTGARFVVESDF